MGEPETRQPIDCRGTGQEMSYRVRGLARNEREVERDVNREDQPAFLRTVGVGAQRDSQRDV